MFCIPVLTYFLLVGASPFSRFTGFGLFSGAFYAPAVTITYCHETNKVFLALESTLAARNRCVVYITSFPQNPLSAESDLLLLARNVPPKQAAETLAVRVSGDWQMHVV